MKNHTKEQDKATARPWISEKGQIKGNNDDGCIVADMVVKIYDERKCASEARANAALIVKAVNSHDALVEALEELLHGEPDRRAYEQAEAVLKAAKGEA